jgi:WD40-like Beta Propeller Repeat
VRNRRLVAAACAALAAGSCGTVQRSDDDTDAGSSTPRVDASPGASADAGADAGDAAPATPCDPDDPIVAVEEVAGANDLAPAAVYHCCLSFGADGIGYFAAGPGTAEPAAADIYRTRRTATGFEPPERVIGALSDDSFWVPSLSSDQLVLFYNHQAPDDAGVEVFASVRPAPGDTFPAGERLDLGGGPDVIQEADPFATDEGLYFQRNQRIHFAAGDGDRFAPGQPVDGLAPELDATDLQPIASADGETLYWAREQPGTGGRDIWMARRAGGPGAFDAPRPVPERTGGGEPFNSPEFEGPSWESPDRCDLYFTTLRNGRAEIWVGHRRAP